MMTVAQKERFLGSGMESSITERIGSRHWLTRKRGTGSTLEQALVGGRQCLFGLKTLSGLISVLKGKYVAVSAEKVNGDRRRGAGRRRPEVPQETVNPTVEQGNHPTDCEERLAILFLERCGEPFRSALISAPSTKMKQMVAQWMPGARWGASKTYVVLPVESSLVQSSLWIGGRRKDDVSGSSGDLPESGDGGTPRPRFSIVGRLLRSCFGL